MSTFGLFLAAGSASTEAIRLVLTQFVLQVGPYFVHIHNQLC